MLNREDARKQHSPFDNIRFALGEMKYIGYRYYGYLLWDIISQMLVPFFLVLIPAEVVRMFQEKQSIESIISSIIFWMSGILIMNLFKTFTHQKMQNMAETLATTQYWRKLHHETLSCDLLKLESSQDRDLLSEVRYALYGSDGQGNYSGIIGFYMYGIALVVNVGGFLIYAAMAGNLHPLLLIILFFTSLINIFVKNKAIQFQFKHMDKFWENSDRFWYMKNESINTEKAKDIRMYRLSRWFEKALDDNTKEASTVYGGIMNYHFYANSMISFSSLFRDGFAYLFLIYQLVQGNLDIATFIVYLGIVAGFGVWITKIVESYTFVNRISDGVSLFRAYIEQGTKDEMTKEITIPKNCEQILFDNIGFEYEAGKAIFENFSLSLQAGEKIALVGVNGAGKTTLTKLLCGLYPLKSGRITIDGSDSTRFDLEQYYRYFSILFQDVNVLPFSIAKNVACAWPDEELTNYELDDSKSEALKIYNRVEKDHGQKIVYDEEKIIACLKAVNLWDKVSALPNGIHTCLTKILDPAGIRLSGGETQRLMLARALYKDAPILILDEPTSALDPIAESELYEEYAQLCEDKISIFISHRLSSTRFCDRILFLEHGKIVEQGTHDELMELQGKYSEMYQIQSHYYQKEVMKHESGI